MVHRRARAQNRVHVGQIFQIHRQRHGDRLHLVPHSLVEQRAQGAVNQAGDERRPLRRVARRAS